MKTITKLLCLLAVSLPVSIVSMAQYNDDLSDFETWSSIGLEYNIDKWEFGLEEQLRMKNNSSIIDQYFTQLEAGYALFKNFELVAGARFIRNNDTKGKIQGYENHLRLQLDAGYKLEVNRFTLGLRFRYQNKNELGISSLAGDYPSQHIRLRPSLEYNIKNWKFDPKISGEIFHFSQSGEENIFDKYRITFGTNFKIWNLGKLGIYYRLEREINTLNPLTANILKIKYVYSF